jgi:hypothetical protein
MWKKPNGWFTTLCERQVHVRVPRTKCDKTDHATFINRLFGNVNASTRTLMAAVMAPRVVRVFQTKMGVIDELSLRLPFNNQ